MAVPAVIETARLRLEPFEEHHLTPRYVSWLHDPVVVRFSEQRHRSHTVDSCRTYLQQFHDSSNYLWAIVARNPSQGHVGNISAMVDVANSLADVAMLLGARDLWGRGFGTEAWTAVCSYLLGAVGLRKVGAGTLSVNEGMLRIMRRSGMVEDGRRLRHYLIDGKEVDLIHMALFPTEEPH